MQSGYKELELANHYTWDFKINNTSELILHFFLNVLYWNEV